MKITDLFNFEKLEYKWNYIETIPEFAKLKECKQNPKWHSEGDVFTHTKKVCEETIKYLKQFTYTFTGNDTHLIGAALFHDIGKGVTTEFKKGVWHSYGHEIEGEKITRMLLWDEDTNLRESICSLVRWHMEPLTILKHKHYIEHLIELSNKVNINNILTLKRFDILGSIPEDKNNTEINLLEIDKVKRIANDINCLYRPSMVFKYGNNTSKNKQIDVHVMIGISGAGKSTVVENHIMPYNNKISKDKNIVVVSRDIARVALGYCQPNQKYLGTKEQEEVVTDYCNELIRKTAENGDNLIIDDMHLKREYRDKIKELLKEYNVKYIYHYVEASNINKNIKRRENQMPEEIIKSMIWKLNFPTFDEYDKLTIYNN